MIRVVLLLGLGRLALAGTNEEGLKFLEENRKRDEVAEIASGLQYEILATGPEDGPHPNVSSPCLVHYTGKLLNGEVFDSSVQRGKPITFQPNQVVKGWTEALQLMRPGDKWKIFLPSELAYGDKGAGGKIPGGAVLVFELELIEVKDALGMVETVTTFFKDNPMIIFIICAGIYMLYTNFAGGVGDKKQLSIDEALAAKENVTVFFEMQAGDSEETHRIEMVLFTKHYPKTAENFRALCTGEKGKGKSGKNLHFKDSKFHRVIPGFMCQGGDFTAGNGTGGESIYGMKFNDEWDNGYVAHDRPYLLSMANAGPNTNGSQFFLTVAKTPHLNGKHVVFGQVVSGEDSVKTIEALGSGGGATKKPVIIKDCGEVKSKST